MGGKGSFDYVSAKGSSGYVAAIVPIAGWGDASKSGQFKDIAVWAFHGSIDNIVAASSSVDMINAINTASPNIRAKLTIYPGVDHFSWPKTYDGSGKGDESQDHDPFDMDIYEWMYLFENQ